MSSSHHHHHRHSSTASRPKYYSRKDKENEQKEKLRRGFRVKCKFRSLVRRVIANHYWLIQGIDDYEGLEDVQRRVAQAVRGKKKHDLLSLTDKALLHRKAQDRTDEEKTYLYKIIGNLNCFKRYPNNVKKKLAAVTYFQYYGPGRTIIRQHQEAHALYFIIGGTVVVTQSVYDELLQQDVSMQVGDLGPGDMFGEISLLHNIKRTATVTTTDHCELLQVMKNDFKVVLQFSIQKEWDEVLKAMSSFTYFEALDDVSRREGCLLAQLKSFQPNETLYGDGFGVPNFVYFVLSGQCQMIESLRIRIDKRNGKKRYSLFEPFDPQKGDDVEDAENNIDKFLTRYAQRLRDMDSVDFSSTRSNKKSKDIRKHSVYYVPVTLGDKESNLEMHNELLGEQNDPRRSMTRSRDPTVRYSSDNRSLGSFAFRTLDTIVIDHEYFAKPASKQNIKMDSKFSVKDIKHPDTSSGHNLLALHSEAIFPNDPRVMKTIFMQVCRLNAGTCFGLGEDLRDRRIIALEKVDCMLLPKVWLLQRNTTNIWTRIQHYMERKLPTKRQMFEEFVEARRWAAYRKKVYMDVASKSKAVNFTTIHDVPYSIRLEEMDDDSDF